MRIVTQMRIIHPRKFQAQPAQRDAVVPVNKPRPAARLKSIMHTLNRKRHTRTFLNFLRRARLPQIPCRILQHRSKIAVRARHENPRKIQERVKRLQERVKPTHMREVIARIHHQIRVQSRQRMHELGLRPLPRNHVHIRNMQNPKVWRPHRKHRESFLAHLKIIQFDEAPIRRRGGSQSKPCSRKLHHTLCEVRTTCRFRSRHGCAGTGCVLTHRVPFFSTPS